MTGPILLRCQSIEPNVELRKNLPAGAMRTSGYRSASSSVEHLVGRHEADERVLAVAAERRRDELDLP